MTPDPDDTAGLAVLHRVLATLPLAPGVYRMLDEKGDALYVGKARSLKKRVYAYTQIHRLPERLQRMVRQTRAMEIITTHTEAEALLLEANLIKKLKPVYNIVLRDDKSYPWLLLTEDHPFPHITKHRGARSRKGSFWGPFASGWAAKQAVMAMQRLFLLRSCTDAVFANRTRPCLLYQIKRCSGPCVGRISGEDYGKLVAQAKAFLSGKSAGVQRDLAQEMEAASDALEFERAATLRDRIRGLASIAQAQGLGVVNPATLDDADIIAGCQQAGQSCVQVFFVRGGHNNGNRAFFPSHPADETIESILSAFIAQFYDDKPPPALLLLNHALPEQDLMADALAIRAGRRVEIAVPQRGEKRALVDHAATNAHEALERRFAENASQTALLAGVASVFGLPAPPQRIECYDNSHIMGRNAYGAMIVAGPEGFSKNHYRRYTIRGPLTPGDDFAMMREVLQRRFAKAKTADARHSADWPGLLLIDGGAGQLSAARDVLAALGVLEDLCVVAIAKGPNRNAGLEWFHTLTKDGAPRPPFQLPLRDPVLYYLQRIRDEAHRFVITTHRAGRARALSTSALDEIEGIGPARKRALLNHFGSVRGVKQAGLPDLENVPGVSRDMARRIYRFFNPTATLPE